MASSAGLGTVDGAPGAASTADVVVEEKRRADSLAGWSVAFGYMPNDLPLLAWSGWACAVANCHPCVLDRDEMVPGNDEDGVARTSRRLLRR